MFKVLFFPFFLVWKLIEIMFGILGSLMAMIIGFVVLVVGITLTVTFIGAIIGVPLITIGGLLVVRSIFK